MNLEARFSGFIEKTDSCWLWTGAKLDGRYGALQVAGRPVGAHRVSYQLHVGPIPEGFCVLHRCDTPACINPDHLFLGTHQDDMRDRDSKGRGRHKLNEETVRRIKSEYEPRKTSLRALAARYGVSHGAIQLIVTGATWKQAG